MVTEDLEDPEWEISDDCRQKSHQIFRKRFTRVWIKRLLRRNEKDRPSVPRSTSFPRGGTKKTVPNGIKFSLKALQRQGKERSKSNKWHDTKSTQERRTQQTKELNPQKKGYILFNGIRTLCN